MQTLTKTIYVYLKVVTKYESGVGYVEKVDYDFCDYERSSEYSPDLILVHTFEVTCLVPDPQPVDTIKLSILNKKKAFIQAEFTAKLTEIQSEINDLLALPAKPDGTLDAYFKNIPF